MAVSQLINVIVNSKGAVTVKRELNAIGDSAQKTSTYVNSLRTILAGALAFSGIGAVSQTIDTFIQLQNRLKLVSESSQEVTSSWAQLVEMADSSYSTIDSTVNLYYRVALAYKAWGESAEEAMKFTGLFQKAAVLSGSTMQTTAQAVYQFSQALNKGKLDGDEFRSVLEGLPYVASIIQDSLGVTRSELYKMSEEGRISVDKVKRAFEEAAATIEGDWKNITPTIGMAVTVLKNNWVDFVGSIQTSTGVFTAVAYGILAVANNFSLLATALTPVVGSLVYLAGRQVLGLAIIGFRDMYKEIKRVIPIVTALNAALWANPYLLAAAAIAALVAGLIYFRNEIGLTDENLKLMWATITQVFTSFMEFLSPVLVMVEQIYDWLTKWHPVFMLIDAIVNTTKADVVSLFTTMIQYLSSVAQYLNTQFGPVFKELWGLLKEVAKLVIEIGKLYLSVWVPAVQALLVAMKTWWEFVGPTIMKLISFLGDVIEGWQKIVKYVSKYVGPVVKDALEGWIMIIKKVIDWVSNLIQALTNALRLMQAIGGGGGAPNASIKSAPGANYGAQFYAGEFDSGGRFKVPGTGAGRDQTPVAFRANRGERVTVETKRQQRMNDNGQAPIINVTPRITNVIDPSMALEAINTAQGSQTIINSIKANREEIMAILGAA